MLRLVVRSFQRLYLRVPTVETDMHSRCHGSHKNIRATRFSLLLLEDGEYLLDVRTVTTL